MRSRLARRLAVASVVGVSLLATACPPPWAFWRHERRQERHERRDDRYERRDDRRDDRHERHHDRRDERRERHERH